MSEKSPSRSCPKAASWLDAEAIIHGPLNPLLAAEIPFGCLHGNVAQKELNLLQFAAFGMAQLCARTAKIMWSEPRKTKFRSLASLRYVMSKP